MPESVMVFTSKPLETMFAEGGSGHWGANKSRLAKCEFIIATKSDTLAEHFPKDNVPRGSAFVIGKISGIQDVPDSDRYIIQFEEFAEISVPNAWIGHRNPVAYLNIQDFEKEHRISIPKLEWKKFPKDRVEQLDPIKALTIDEAKRGLAKGLGIPMECIEIKISA